MILSSLQTLGKSPHTTQDTLTRRSGLKNGVKINEGTPETQKYVTSQHRGECCRTSTGVISSGTRGIRSIPSGPSCFLGRTREADSTPSPSTEHTALRWVSERCQCDFRASCATGGLTSYMEGCCRCLRVSAWSYANSGIVSFPPMFLMHARAISRKLTICQHVFVGVLSLSWGITRVQHCLNRGSAGLCGNFRRLFLFN